MPETATRTAITCAGQWRRTRAARWTPRWRRRSGPSPARRELLTALTLDPDDQVRGDIEDMLNVIAAATGDAWDETLVERAKPRDRQRRAHAARRHARAERRLERPAD
jgi:hypothetical protein